MVIAFCIVLALFLAGVVLTIVSIFGRKSIKFNEYQMRCNGLPVISLNSNGKKFNFLVDTGSNLSHLKLGVAELMDSTPVDVISGCSVVTGNGEAKQYGYYDVNLNLGKDVFTHRFEIMDLEDTFKDWGMVIHGIIGVDFLVKYKYSLDFALFRMYA